MKRGNVFLICLMLLLFIQFLSACTKNMEYETSMPLSESEDLANDAVQSGKMSSCISSIESQFSSVGKGNQRNSSFVTDDGFSSVFSINSSKPADNTPLITGENMQYLAVHKIDVGSGSLAFHQNNPASFSQMGFSEIIDAIGKGGQTRKLAISFTFSYLNDPVSTINQSIGAFLELSQKNDVPVILHLDGVNWWSKRPDLWNWWDSEKSGYNPNNINNVERYGWDMSAAVKIGWRNWGSQIRVSPAPNLGSAQFREANREALDFILPTIVSWYSNLPNNKKYLLGGVVLGWELSPYVQSYFYQNGNSYLSGSASNDPKTGILASLPLGYAAAQTLGIQTSGKISVNSIDKVCKSYMDFLIGVALEKGIPSNKIITHTFRGGATANGGGHTGSASISGVSGVIPGWSWYDANLSDLDKIISTLNGKPWACIETKPGVTLASLKELINHKNCRYFNIFNWEDIRNSSVSLYIKSLLNEKT